MELHRRITQADLVVTDMAAVSRTILAAFTDLRRGERVQWQVVFGGGVSARPDEWSLSTKLGGRQARRQEWRRTDIGVVGATIRIGAVASTPERSRELVNRLRRAAASVSAPRARLKRRMLPSWLVATRLARAATPVTAAAVPADSGRAGGPDGRADRDADCDRPHPGRQSAITAGGSGTARRTGVGPGGGQRPQGGRHSR